MTKYCIAFVLFHSIYIESRQNEKQTNKKYIKSHVLSVWKELSGIMIKNFLFAQTLVSVLIKHVQISKFSIYIFGKNKMFVGYL